MIDPLNILNSKMEYSREILLVATGVSMMIEDIINSSSGSDDEDLVLYWLENLKRQSRRSPGRQLRRPRIENNVAGIAPVSTQERSTAHFRQVAGDTNVSVEKVTEPYGLSEGPHWDHRTQKLYFVDIYNQYIRRLDPATGVVTNAYIENGTVGVVVPVHGSPDKLIAGVGKDIVLVTWDGDQNETEVPTKILCSVDKNAATRINDGKIDSCGRFWLGTMGEDENQTSIPNIGSLYRLDYQNESCTPKKEISPVSISNGLAWNIEDNTFYYIDSPTRQIIAYDYQPHSGSITNKKIVFDLNKTTLKGLPDGMTIDTNGNLWIALFGGSHVINIDPKTGKLLRKVEIPAENVTSVAFGGSLLDILYVTTSGYGLTAEQRETTPDAGAVFAIKGLGVRGSLANTFQMNQ